MLRKNKTLKMTALVTLLAAGAAVVCPGFSASALEAWGPQDRPTYTMESPANEPVFNSITNNINPATVTDPNDDPGGGENANQLGTTVDYTDPNNNPSGSTSTVTGLGDERNFVRIREAGTDNFYEDLVEAEPGKEYEVYVYFHNNASPSLQGLTGWAWNTRLKIEAPERISTGQTAVIKGIISWQKQNAANAETFNVWDTTFLKATDEIYLRYVDNSAVIHSRGDVNGTVLSSAALFDTDGYGGAFLGYLKNTEPDGSGTNMWGVIPGCNQYAGYVTFRIKADQPKFYVEKEVLVGDEWKETTTAAPGETLHFRLHYYNIGTVEQENVNAQDVLPEGMSYVTTENPTTPEENVKVRLVNTRTGATSPSVDSEVFIDPNTFFGDSGIVVGTYAAGTEFIIYYDVKIADEESFTECSTDLWNRASVHTANGGLVDRVKVTVKKECKTPEEIPETGSNVTTVVAVSVCAGAVVCIFTAYISKRFRK